MGGLHGACRVHTDLVGSWQDRSEWRLVPKVWRRWEVESNPGTSFHCPFFWTTLYVVGQISWFRICGKTTLAS